MENGGTDRGRWSEEEGGDEREGMRLGGGRETRRQKHFYLDNSQRSSVINQTSISNLPFIIINVFQDYFHPV